MDSMLKREVDSSQIHQGVSVRAAFIVVLLAGLALFGCSQEGAERDANLVVQDSVAPYYTSLESALAAAQSSDRHVAVDFYTDWCVWCKVIDTAVYESPTGIDFFTNKMILAKINAEVDTLSAQKYSISGYPTIVLMDKTGAEVDRVIGYFPVDEFLLMLDNYTKGIGTLDDLVAKAQDSTDRSLYLNIADKYKYRGRPDDAQAWFTKVVEMGEPTDSLSGEARMSMADLYRRAKEYDKALAAYQAIEKDFNSVIGQDAVIWQGLMYKYKGDTAGAISEFERYIRTYPEAEDAKYAAGQIDELKNPTAEPTN